MPGTVVGAGWGYTSVHCFGAFWWDGWRSGSIGAQSYSGRMARTGVGRGPGLAERAGWLEWPDSAPICAIIVVGEGKYATCLHF